MTRQPSSRGDAWIDGGLRLVLLLAVLAVVGAAVSMLRTAPMAADAMALGVPARDTGDAAAATPSAIAAPSAGGDDTSSLADAAIARNPFSPRRRPPRERYVLVRDDDVPAFDESPAVPIEPPVVFGTAASAGGAGFAMCSWGGAPAVVTRVGDTIGPFTVLEIARGQVTFRGPDGERLVVDTSVRSDGDPS